MNARIRIIINCDDECAWNDVLRWLDWIFLGGYLPSLSLNYVGMSKDMEKRLPKLYYIKMKISYDLGLLQSESPW